MSNNKASIITFAHALKPPLLLQNRRNIMCLESDQARRAKQCCKGGKCPICNPPIVLDTMKEENADPILDEMFPPPEEVDNA